jgi:UDP-hydrolysing UDP-N-acetyl-D-glucosamine 2-epimerase
LKKSRPTKIAVITGTRAEFGIWRPVLAAIQQSKKLQLQLLVTGMHLQKNFGNTVQDIENANVPIAAKIPMYHANEPPSESLARATAGIAKALRHLQPHLVMVLGDRLEILAAANAALANQLPLAHLHGGETAPGQWDEQIRHAVTKIAHLHFCATKKAAQRIRQMGENPKTIHVVGAPALDLAIQHVKQQKQKTGRALVVLHPSSPDPNLEEKRARMILQALHARGLQPTVIGPNNDPGHEGILAAIANTNPIMSVPQQTFWQLLAGSDLLIGNSSSGILEAATFATPVINIGDRQSGRERNPNIIDTPWNPKAIQAAIQKATSKQFQKITAKRQNLYGDGQAAQRILKTLESLKPPIPITKHFHD